MNKDNYKKALDQIHASEELKDKTIEKMQKPKSKKTIYINILSACAVFVLVFCLGYVELNKEGGFNLQTPPIAVVDTPEIKQGELTKFKDLKELKSVLKENRNYYTKGRGIVNSGLALPETVKESATVTDEISSTNRYATNDVKQEKDFSTTNVQVENVDEADIVKTDGEYIYYTTYEKVYIVKADSLDVVSSIEISEEKEKFNPSELFINKDKLIVLGNLIEYSESLINENIYDDISYNYAGVTTMHNAVAIVYDISNKQEPKQIRKAGLDGYYVNSRMIGDNVYFISTKNIYYYDGIKDDEILPRVQNNEKLREIAAYDIVYFKDSSNYNYMLIGGFNVNNEDDMNVETFFGASGDDVYSSEQNLYIAQSYYYNGDKTEIYKFSLNNSEVKFRCKGEVKGHIDDQFSMDEYEGNLRIATTYYIEDENTSVEENNIEEKLEDSEKIEIDADIAISSENYKEPQYSNGLFILDENLNEIGKIENLALDERIYSVRFMGKLGYIVTFEQVDPLFVIDLSDPRNPQVKGELKIPGYSSYLHPYDETHLIGIGYNTKSNGYGRSKNRQYENVYV